MGLQESLDDPASKYMSKAFARVDAEESIYHAAMAMKQAGSTEALVLQGGAPVGIITERDILYKVVAAGLVPQHVKSKDVMSSPLETIEGSAKVWEAIAKMSKLGIRRLGVLVDGKLEGFVTQRAMVSSGAEMNVPLPELVNPGGSRCPYCGAIVKNGEELSKHIDRTHTGGLGLLQGDSSKW